MRFAPNCDLQTACNLIRAERTRSQNLYISLVGACFSTEFGRVTHTNKRTWTQMLLNLRCRSAGSDILLDGNLETRQCEQYVHRRLSEIAWEDGCTIVHMRIPTSSRAFTALIYRCQRRWEPHRGCSGLPWSTSLTRTLHTKPMYCPGHRCTAWRPLHGWKLRLPRATWALKSPS